MELVIRSTGDKTSIEINGKELEKITMINFAAAVRNGVQCVFEQVVTDEYGHVLLSESGDEIKREIHRVDLARGEII